jgi:pilus assembly protein FimV
MAICLAMALPTASNALSLGDIESKSSLNQPFQGRINLLSTTLAEAKSLRVRVAPAAVFNRVGIDRPAFLNSIRFRTTVQNGKPVILVSSNQPINEPFLNFLLEVSWPNGQLLKEYTVLLDPPVLMRPNTAIASNNAGVRAEPRAQGRITRPAVQQRRAAPQPRVAPRRTPQQVRQAQRLQRQVSATQQKRVAEQRQLLAAQRKLAAENGTATRAASASSNKYRVRRGDTLSKVAKKLGYRGVRKGQMMVALFEKNRRAFSKGNMNNLKAGVLMTRPSLQQSKSTTSRAARAQIVAQAREWKKLRVASTKTAGSKSAASTRSARIEVVGSKNTIDKGSQAGNASVTGLNNQLTLLTESLTTKQKENEELKSRVTDLESLLRKKNRLITLKSEQLSQLQSGMNATAVDPSSEVKAPEEATTDAAEVVNAPVVTNEGTDIQQEVANTLANENGEIVRAENKSAFENIEPSTETVEPEVASEEPASPFTNEADEKGSFDVMSLLEDPRALGVGCGTLLALLGGFWYMRRRKANEYQDSPDFVDDTNIDVDEHAEEFSTSTQIDDSEMFDESEYVDHDEVTKAEDISESEEVSVETEEENDELEDIIQEADVYIVYGLHDQAESEIKRAITEHPGSAALHAKLLENYQAAGDKEAFEKEAKIFLDLDADNKDKYWDDICNWGKVLLPENTMFDKSESGGSASKIAAATAATGVAMVAGTAISDALSSDDSEILDALASEESEDISSLMETSSEEFEKLDIEIDVDDQIEDFDFDDVLSEDITGMDKNGDLDLDFDETGSDEFDQLLGDESLTASLDSEDIEIQDLAGEMTIEADLDSTSLNLDLDSDDFDKLMPENHAYKSTDSDDQAEVPAEDSLEEIVAETKQDDAEDDLLAGFDDNLSFLDLDNDSDVIEETQIETKIDLAKAYIDMGDIDGARSTLEEVIEDGSEDQKREAEELLQHNG